MHGLGWPAAPSFPLPQIRGDPASQHALRAPPCRKGPAPTPRVKFRQQTPSGRLQIDAGECNSRGRPAHPKLGTARTLLFERHAHELRSDRVLAATIVVPPRSLAAFRQVSSPLATGGESDLPVHARSR